MDNALSTITQFNLTKTQIDSFARKALEKISNKKKQREEMLKHLSDPVADPETGEMIFPAQFKTTSVISIFLPR